MNATSAYLDAIQARMGLTSDYQLAKAWGVSPQRISEYRHGIKSFSDDRCLEIADILGIDPGRVLIEIHADRARKLSNPTVAGILDGIARKLGGMAAAIVLFIAGLAGLTASAPADANLSEWHHTKVVSNYLTDNANYAHHGPPAALFLYAICLYFARVSKRHACPLYGDSVS